MILNEDGLFRRVLPFHIKPGGEVSSSAYMTQRKKPDHELSLDLERLATPRQTQSRDGKNGFAVGRFTAQLPRSIDLDVRHDPLPTNDAHCLAAGENTFEKCRILADGTKVVLHPPTRG